MDLRLTGNVAIVQGASRGLGRGIAEALAAEGCDLIVSARSEGPLREAAAAISQVSGRRAIPVAMDSSDAGAAVALVQAARSNFGRLDIVLANSGGPPPGGALDLADAQWAAAAELLLISPMRLIRESLPLLRESPAPRVMIVTSSSTRQPVPGLTLSNTFRPAICGLVKTLSEELARDRVRIHSLAPGRFDTDRLREVIQVQSARSGKTPEQVTDAMLASIPAGRLGEPIELGHLAAFLASPLADYLTGCNWLIDGGLIRAI
jgi:3-oxoacyl-[acyl-carrier protein] reductase